ncbi:helix-turn-helix domain-containing protein [Chitinolyticbacter meiyuanensis]|uniref:helix-turn-helix domain-containing protein n=1 Tax=Chitinolyticbacter meiyuanensis TaxID=682798 RepID=UPI0011E59BAB|nr:helix-turn-helix transcriptional regulator [Chitinolyticbacter meiyuanensis]
MNAAPPVLGRQFGQVIRRWRRQHHWSQEALAERADLNRSYLGEIERGDAMPSLDTAAKLARALGVKLSVLIAFCE